MVFNDEYYKKIITEYRYDPMDFCPMDFWFDGISPQIMDQKWLCHSGVNKIKNYDKTIFTTGIGLSGTPHMGTMSQILRIIFLQKQGFDVQMVLGDLDSYNARNQDLDIVLRRAENYRDFIVKLGFDEKKGILRSQYYQQDVTQLAFIVSKYLSDQDFLDAEEDLSELYIKEKIYKGITYPVKQAILLMVSDFIQLGYSKGYESVVVMLGLEEHLYVLLAKKILERMKLEFGIWGLYSRVIKGLNNYPKMSKSIPLSSIRVDMSQDEIRAKILNEKDDYRIPEESVIYQLITSVSDYSMSDLASIYEICRNKDKEWQDVKNDYANRLINICKAWTNE